ncbi:MAG TPA: hypothetical protein VMB80_13875 [Candidatus Acidoferrum sp.]|nr:hypothetical protein [Candidatus Acidoferrum sp.]
MKTKLRQITVATLAALLCSCAATELKSTWKAPDYRGGPVGKIAVLEEDDGVGYRPMFEGQFVRQLEQQGQPAFKSLDLLTLSEIQADKEAAADKLHAAGADCVLIVRLVERVNQSSLAARNSGSTVTSDSGKFGWLEYSTTSASRGRMEHSLKLHVYIETSLYQLDSGKKLWSGVTRTVLHEDTDRMAEIEPMVAKVLEAMRADGLIR